MSIETAVPITCSTWWRPDRGVVEVVAIRRSQ
jgi:hypothetical protein